MIMKKLHGVKCELTLEYQKFVKQMWLNKAKGCENPSRLFGLFKKKFKQFNNTDQQDSHEMLICMLDALDMSLRPFKSVHYPGDPNNHSLVREIFYGKMLHEIVTPEGTIRHQEENVCHMIFLDKNTTIQNILNEHTRWIYLDNYKNDDGVHQAVTTTRQTFWYSPYILMFTFKMYTGKYRIKLTDTLDITPWFHRDSPHKKQNTKYQLFATCTHEGSTQGGHYISNVRHHGKWYMKDDVSVQETVAPLEDYHYVVFYKSV